VAQHLEKPAMPQVPATEPERAGSRPAGRPAGTPAGRTTKQWWRRPWVAPLFLVVLAFLAFIWPPYLGFHASQARVPINPTEPEQYPLIITHIICGTVAVLTVCLQLWPWLRNNYPAVHRWSGRIYVFAGALPCSLLIFALIPLAGTPVGSVGFAVAGAGWLVTTIMGYIRGRQRRYVDHRRWMLYSFAFATNQIWTRVFFFIIFSLAHQGHNEALLSQVGEATTWIGFIINVPLVRWWLDRTPRQERQARALSQLAAGGS